MRDRQAGGDETPRGRGRNRRSREYGTEETHETVLCPGCRSSIAYRTDTSGPPAVCGGCGYRLRCESCESDIRFADSRFEESDPEVDDEDLPVARPSTCPRCGQPPDGSDAPDLPGEDDSFTWGNG